MTFVMSALLFFLSVSDLFTADSWESLILVTHWEKKICVGQGNTGGTEDILIATPLRLACLGSCCSTNVEVRVVLLIQ